MTLRCICKMTRIVTYEMTNICEMIRVPYMTPICDMTRICKITRIVTYRMSSMCSKMTRIC